MSSPKKAKMTWPEMVREYAAEYGLDYEDLRRVKQGFALRVALRGDQIGVEIFRLNGQNSEWPDAPMAIDREDGFEPIDLMLSGQIPIVRSQKLDGSGSEFYVRPPEVNPISLHHPNKFGPERGLVIAEMIRVLSQELQIIHTKVRKTAARLLIC